MKPSIQSTIVIKDEAPTINTSIGYAYNQAHVEFAGVTVIFAGGGSLAEGAEAAHKIADAFSAVALYFENVAASRALSTPAT